MTSALTINPRTTQLFPEGPHLTVRMLNVDDDNELRQAWDVKRVVDEEKFGSNELRSAEQLRVEVADTEYMRQAFLVAEVESLEGATMIAGLACVRMPLQHDTDSQVIDIAVYPAWRSKGIGGALLEGVQEIVKKGGRSTVTAYGVLHTEQDPESGDSAAAKLAARLGMKKVAVEQILTAALPLDRDLVEDLYMEVDSELGKYRIITWRDEVPEENLEQWHMLLRQFDEDVPNEDLVAEHPEHNEERTRSLERDRAARGVRQFVAVALAPNGTFAGKSVVHFRDDGSGLAYQGITVVMPDHRGHKLGLALKLMTHRSVSEIEPRVRTIGTFNSHVNEHMLEVNKKLGYSVAGHEVAFQGRVKK